MKNCYRNHYKCQLTDDLLTMISSMISWYIHSDTYVMINPNSISMKTTYYKDSVMFIEQKKRSKNDWTVCIRFFHRWLGSGLVLCWSNWLSGSKPFFSRLEQRKRNVFNCLPIKRFSGNIAVKNISFQYSHFISLLSIQWISNITDASFLLDPDKKKEKENCCWFTEIT